MSAPTKEKKRYTSDNGLPPRLQKKAVLECAQLYSLRIYHYLLIIVRDMCDENYPSQ
jgi:hypothetical protein